ncbi:type II secretion system minor pseudopilin GspK [Puniceibacterium sp. IMCC21224]|uniref:type II secretion system minor pseudopilin GspK n=1 Tax=Puniceibacterium sp. IMCC21224 TaxID=1618204 RepID=UPI00064D76EC|nr:type II secretion system minor pseudopilin GspK [Puniceibacterium sp. IMCC21224]KMK64007.1 type II secretory pathway, component PulK [Puniceibacterium sp. IMCC21224]
MSWRGGTSSRGFVLVNALVLVAALAGIAVLLLSRAEAARVRQLEIQTSAQLGLYLDAFESLALTLLSSDRAGAPVDHLGESWAQADYDVQLDRGRVTGQITDLQSRFNINWLSNQNDTLAEEGFARLTARLGILPQAADAISGFLGPGGPDNATPYARLNPPIRPVGGPVLILDQLATIVQLSARDLDRLRPFIAALPGGSKLNVNTASATVLQSLIPGLSAALADRLVQLRSITPFTSGGEFVERLTEFGGVALTEDLDPARLDAGSKWFEVRMQADLDGRQRGRVAVLERRPLPEPVRVAYRRDIVE